MIDDAVVPSNDRVISYHTMQKLTPGYEFVYESQVMDRALLIAQSREGFVEPNPCVGAVIVDPQLRFIAEGCHERYGGPHAEVMALRQAGDAARGAWLFVTLEPCNHHGKTPPCTEAVIQSGVSRVFISVADPANHGFGPGVEKLLSAGIDVQLGLKREEGETLLAPFTTFMTKSRPYVHAKWAMTLDGKVATSTGHSKWITNETSRAQVHALRGRMDAILTGIGTVLADDPLLTARPAGARVPLRVVLDSQLRIPLDCQLVRTAKDTPVLLFTTAQADEDKCRRLSGLGVEVIQLNSAASSIRCHLEDVLSELKNRQVTNLLLEAGSGILGAFHDARLIDEVHCFIAPKLVGGASAISPIGGQGQPEIPAVPSLTGWRLKFLDGDIYLRSTVSKLK
ncbi:bifunctional diaminohydroxyphosphoribosylaminopyrimidine deaminase/5-amino-6-(5-phosphoribosylamino)uracil reductase RibD [Planctomicrobium sp. SH668]|uniref:bifunctional diaminohydroxyphosphoribosylaminopyrimidine deaminase/5-amino-6-(5-phosphoribosylamino)uracil reductase RibD n=1 Tax=Planctomicrobium sp. SH668 TaxID=3448126 RepID=UPI003F5AE555